MNGEAHRQVQALCLMGRLGLLSSREVSLGWTDAAWSVLRGWRKAVGYWGPAEGVTEDDLAALGRVLAREEVVQ